MASKPASQVTKKVSVSVNPIPTSAPVEHIVALDETGQFADEKVLVINPR